MKIPVVPFHKFLIYFIKRFWHSDLTVQTGFCLHGGASQVWCHRHVLRVSVGVTRRTGTGIWFQWFWPSRLKESKKELDLSPVHPGLIKDNLIPIWAMLKIQFGAASPNSTSVPVFTFILWFSPVCLFICKPSDSATPQREKKKKRRRRGRPPACRALLGLCNQPPVIAHLKVQLY